MLPANSSRSRGGDRNDSTNGKETLQKLQGPESYAYVGKISTPAGDHKAPRPKETLRTPCDMIRDQVLTQSRNA